MEAEYNDIGVKLICFTADGRKAFMKEKAELSLLLDYYGAFLTEKQAEILSMSADEDMSLAEIAETFGVSRQSVRASIVNASEKLENCEERLGLIERDRKLRVLLSGLDEAVLSENIDGIKKASADIRAVLR